MMSPCPNEVGKKQDDNECATGFELLEESGQQIPKNEQFESGSDRRLEKIQDVRMRWAGGWTGAHQVNRDGCEPGKKE